MAIIWASFCAMRLSINRFSASISITDTATKITCFCETMVWMTFSCRLPSSWLTDRPSTNLSQSLRTPTHLQPYYPSAPAPSLVVVLQPASVAATCPSRTGTRGAVLCAVVGVRVCSRWQRRWKEWGWRNLSDSSRGFLVYWPHWAAKWMSRKPSLPRLYAWINFQHPKRFKKYNSEKISLSIKGLSPHALPAFPDPYKRHKGMNYHVMVCTYYLHGILAGPKKNGVNLLVSLVSVGRFTVNSLVDRWHTVGLYCRVTCYSHFKKTPSRLG